MIRKAPSERKTLLTRLREEAELASHTLPPLLIEAERVANTVTQGLHGRRRVGAGETFWQFRRYRAGDTAQQVDWRKSAKSDRLYVRETEWEAAQSLWIWSDTSASMNYASDFASTTKQNRAIVLGLALASLVLRTGERVAPFSTTYVTPSNGRAALRRLAKVLYNEQQLQNLPPLLPLPRYAKFALFGDFLAPLADIEGLLRFYSGRGVKGQLVQIIDPAEEELPFAGRTEFLDLESGRRLFAGRAEELRGAYRRRFAEHSKALAVMARRLGFGMAVHRTDRPAETTLLALYVSMSGELTAHLQAGRGGMAV
jgi:uncharacterized protein (DUF58 family)